MEASAVFEHETGEYTPEYGDNDGCRGNLLVCYWLQDLDAPAAGDAGDAPAQLTTWRRGCRARDVTCPRRAACSRGARSQVGS